MHQLEEANEKVDKLVEELCMISHKDRLASRSIGVSTSEEADEEEIELHDSAKIGNVKPSKEKA